VYSDATTTPAKPTSTKRCGHVRRYLTLGPSVTADEPTSDPTARLRG
jgi:hypothetical protein